MDNLIPVENIKREDFEHTGCMQVIEDTEKDHVTIKKEKWDTQEEFSYNMIKHEELIIKHEIKEEVDKKETDGDCRRKTGKRSSGLKKKSLNKPLDGLVLKCDACDFGTVHPGNLKRHISHVHITEGSKGLKIFSCTKCSYKTKRNEHLKMHEVIHKDATELEVFSCAQCNFQTIRKRSLLNHLKTHMDLTELKLFQCTRCKYRSKYKYNFQIHLLKHMDMNEVETFTCSVCQFQTKYKHLLRKHVKLLHQGENELMYCAQCEYKTYNKGNLRSHLVRHIFRCNQCDFQTTYEKYLLKHTFSNHMDPNPSQ